MLSGAMESDYPSADSEPIKCEASSDSGVADQSSGDVQSDVPSVEPSDMNIGGIRLVQCVTGAASGSSSPESSPAPHTGDDADDAAAASDGMYMYYYVTMLYMFCGINLTWLSCNIAFQV